MVEPQIVVLVVAGSSPVDHPTFCWSDGALECGVVWTIPCHQKFHTPTLHRLALVPVAQLDRASDFGSDGWGFESLQARHIVIE